MITVPVLQVENLTTIVQHRNQSRTVVAGVSFSIAPGRSLGVVGESGAGKSMLIRSILGICPQGVSLKVTGRVQLGENDMLTMSAKARRRVLARNVGVVHQDPLRSLNPTYRIGQQLTEALMFSAKNSSRIQRKQQAVKLLAEVGFHDPNTEVKRFPHQLSGGQRQRVGIAAANIANPILLIGDEPTTALDVTVQKKVLDLLDQERTRTGSSLLLVTHDLAVAAQRCDDIVVMQSGQIVEAGPTQQVLTAPKHHYTQRLLNSVPRLDGPRLARLPVDGQGR